MWSEGLLEVPEHLRYIVDTASVTTETVTPELASIWLRDKKYAHQRSLVQSNLRSMVSTMLQGRFPLTMGQFCTVGDDERIVDFYHRLNGVVQSDRAVRFAIARMVAHSEDHRREYYQWIDNGGAVRRWSQCVDLGGMVSSLGLTKSQIDRLQKTTYLISGHFCTNAFRRCMKTGVTYHDRTKVVNTYSESARQLFDAISGCPADMSKAIQRASVLAIAVVTTHASKVALGFWETTAHTRNLSDGDAREKLCRILRDPNQFKGPRDIEFAKKVAICWNAYVNSEGKSQIRTVLLNRPVRIAGTEFVIGGDET
jgi:hypothetical protein